MLEADLDGVSTVTSALAACGGGMLTEAVEFSCSLSRHVGHERQHDETPTHLGQCCLGAKGLKCLIVNISAT